ncbi:sulfurtransferase [Eikenella corrodens]|uniref:Sulfurtransferase n=1 Tax=Eikenella corrodens TaxID=539 RepID=A0A1A9RPQ9_EIKCO|nr:rhodanese-like domain-containing protein [Eikenella corrodens]OAM21230.1 sulfurtransferase [Eikenella corrodens]
MKKTLSLAAIALLASLPVAASAHGQHSRKPAQQRSQLRQAPARQEAVWIDVRTPEEYAAGHLENAKNIPHDQIGQQIAAHVPNKNTPINLYCRSGRRAETAKQALESMGYTNVQNRGGYEQLKQSGMR